MIFSNISNFLSENKPFVVYRNPNTDIVKCIAQNNDTLHYLNSFSEKGYVFAPFNTEEKSVLIQPDLVFEEAFETTSTKVVLNDNWESPDGKLEHEQLVEKTIDTVANEGLGKIVVSRKEDIHLPDLNIVATFKKMLSVYTNAYVYLWYHPKVGLWSGATPETLLSVKGKEFFTMALAGTQPYKGSTKVTWGAKEIAEQQMVTDYIKEYLKYKVAKIEFSEVETVKAGKLLHLKTDVKGELHTVSDVKEIVSLLHPTPAVCGLPKERSKKFILDNENYNRSFYTGYLGELNINDNSALFVNLRCFEYNNDTVSLYVGGGVTKQSHPEKEWLETVEKSYTIKKVLS